MSQPFFSVIITTYNRPDKLLIAIESVLSQEFKDFEIIIVNDGSIVSYDNVLKHIEGNSKINYFYKINEERSVARNFGVSKAIGDWICYLDDDDIYYPEHLTARYNAILQKKVSNILFYSPTVMKYSNGKIEKAVILAQEYYGTDVLVYNPFAINTACLHSSVAKKNSFNANLRYWEDIEYWMRIILKENLKTCLIREYTTEYIFHNANTVSEWSIKIFQNKIKTYELLKANYSDYLPNGFIENRLYDAFIGAADCLSKEKKRKEGLSYLLKALKYKTSHNKIRPIFGVIKNLVKI